MKGAGCTIKPGKTLKLEGWLKIAYQSMAEPVSQVKIPKIEGRLKIAQTSCTIISR